MERSEMADSEIPPRRGEEEQGGDAEGVPVVAAEEEEKKLEQNDKTHQRLCDFCNESLAILYCRADTAKLCFSCDREVHLGNPLFRKHTRSLLCDCCDSKPASIFCSTENIVLCQNCDWETHDVLSSLHDRRPLEEFSGCPSVTDFSSIFGFDDVGDKSLLPMADQDDGGLVGSGFYASVGGIVDELSDAFVWETSPVVSLDDLILSSNSSHNFQAIGNPPLPKGGALQWHSNSCASAGPEPIPFISIESYAEEILLCHEKPTEFGGFGCHTNCCLKEQTQHPVVKESLQGPPKVTPRELTSQERDNVILRYKEKRKARRFDKRIRYESRKARAESRTRIRGRFAKLDH
ncbi:zinc finger protein CONSTANS-LIKE 13-like isoform X2 [Macadamia integrifolia]|uniref:zinc finger protein CONSTANS-LIKE 13-like isoform X2 n=1 Tax=Macadamia integrifolia TaxID=60698 RepID=UPI001C527EE7|nr:zinc finger protein CONSTANS-LIKE 13-like isoform X2 [Macadamia integrifolia]